MEQQPLNTQLFTPQAFREKLFAGKAATADEELNELYAQFETEFKNAIENKIIGKDEEATRLWQDIFSAVVSGSFAEELMGIIDTEMFYHWGKYLLRVKKKEPALTKLIHEYLNLFRRSSFLKRIYEDKKWEELIFELIKESNYHTGILFEQRVNEYGDKTLFNIIKGKDVTKVKWNEVSNSVNSFARSILYLLSKEKTEGNKVSFLLENCPEMPLLDLACLTTGIVNVMIPVNSVPEHIEFIMNQTGSQLLFVYDEKQLAKIKSVKNKLPELKTVVMLKGTSGDDWVLSFNEFVKSGSKITIDELTASREKINVNSLATIMYTSGTTGEPKGIMFSHMNIVYKRFCRAMALPEIGDADRFLSFLPLFHTFGRWLEMTGSIFWGAEYSFMENPSLETMIVNMQLVHPTIFISIPKKWIQLYEHICSRVDIELDEHEKIKQTVKEVTGGKLKWGLSAAGYLPPDIFRFFQSYGIELMSGFGMTEATGGITMTPPNRYKENSLGKALPGIEIKLADDGEILIKGNYVMMGYFGNENEKTFTKDGWLPTGDIMKMDEDGFIEIIDRKKEIYKNVKGETIAPQKIENYFNEFDSIKQVFLVGDHKPFNTLLIYPDYESETVRLEEMDDKQKREYFSSLVVTVNKFLAPFERIVDFRITERPFTAEQGELTPKGTYKRRVIEKNFADLIDTMYKKNFISLTVGRVEVRIPNWFLREKGLLSGDIIAEENKIDIPKINSSLIVKQTDDKNPLYRIGSLVYRIEAKYIDMQVFFTNPFYWMGNKELLGFTGDLIYQWYRKQTALPNLQYHSTTGGIKVNRSITEELRELFVRGEISLKGIHLAALLLQSESTDEHITAIDFLQNILKDETNHHFKLALEIAHRPNLTGSLQTRRNLFRAATIRLPIDGLDELLRLFIEHNFDFIDEEIINYLVETRRSEDIPVMIENILSDEVNRLVTGVPFNKSPVSSLMDLLLAYSNRHPASFKRIRRSIMRYAVFGKSNELKEKAETTLQKLQTGLREWLGKNQTVAIDMETGEEYGWEDVFTFEQGIDPEDRLRMKNAFTKTSVLREAIFLFSKGVLLRLDNILPGGIWISHLETKPYKSIYRVSLQTRFQGAFDLTIHLAHNLPPAHIKEEVKWLILPATTLEGTRLLPKFGGYWEEYELWTEEFVPRESVEKFIQKTVRKNEEAQLQRLYHLWPYFVWNAAAAYMNFWKLTNYEIELANPLPENISIPTHDYQTGTLLYSVSKRIRSGSILEFFKNFYILFVKRTVDNYSFLRKESIWNYIFSGVIEVEGEDKGMKQLHKFREELSEAKDFPDKKIVRKRLDSFIENIETNGFIPKALFFAIKRFHRWFEINTDAALTAQAEMLYELYETYHLFELEESHPSTRTVFFIETAFIDSDEEFKKALRDIARRQHRESLPKEKVLSLISGLQTQFKLSEKENFFITRLSYPHLKPTDSAKLLKVKTEEGTASNLVVQVIDNDGNPFLIRNPSSPKEISRLHQLFFDSDLDVHFRPEHRFLVAISERGFIIGGLFYKYVDDRTVYMEKIVVSNRYRRKGISDALMNELFNRMRSEHIKFVTTGFFRPEYFYKFGFKVERKYSGLVKEL